MIDNARYFNAGDMRSQAFISRFCVPFTQPYDFDELINNALFELRDFTGTDRAVILEFQPDGSLLCTYESVKDGEIPGWVGQSLAYDEVPIFMESDKTGCFYEKDAVRYFENYPVQYSGEKSFCCIPIKIGGNRVGYLVFFTLFEHANWAECEFRLATMAGSIIAGAYSRKKSEAVMLAVNEAELRTHSFISRFSVPFTRPYDFDELINNALFELRDFTETDRAAVLELMQDGSLLCSHESVINDETPSLLGSSLRYEDKKQILDEAERTGCFYQRDSARYLREHSIEDLGEKSFCCIPLMIEGERAGYLVFFTMFKQADWAEGEFRLATMAGSIIAGAFSNRKNSILKEEAIKAQQACEAKSKFLSVMSHEMRTPLNAIIGMTSIAKNSRDMTRKDYALKKIEDASVSLLGIINDVLDMAKIEANRLELSPIEFNIERMLQKLLSVAKFRMDEKRQKFELQLDARTPHFIVGDDQRLSQVVTNLLTNASKFTPEGGDIRLCISLENEENSICKLRFEVTDNGIGISPEHQEKLFDAFIQAESGTSRAFGGTGLGLALSKRIVELMDGRIWVESELGKGARFIFTARAGRGKQHLLSLLDPGIKRDDLDILVVDDDHFTRTYFVNTLNHIGVRCSVAAGGEEALRLLDEHGDYDIYFVDWHIFGMDGNEFTRRIKARERKNKSVVTMISGDWETARGVAFEAGADKFLTKPLFASTIIEHINECLEAKAARRGETFTKATLGMFSGKRLLIAEDVEINREIVISLLEDTGLIIDEAENGREAFLKVRADPGRYDLVFMDIQMPKMDGLEATRKIRSLPDERAKTLPIIAMTANVFKEDVEKCRAAGTNGHIGKPLALDEVLAVMKDYLI